MQAFSYTIRVIRLSFERCFPQRISPAEKLKDGSDHRFAADDISPFVPRIRDRKKRGGTSWLSKKNKSAIWSNELSPRVVPNYIPTPQESDETVSGTSV